MRAREFIVLLEYRRDVTAQRLGQKILARNQAADMTKLESAEEILAQLETADPTKNMRYTQWLANRYIAGDFFLEDLEVVKRYLEQFVEVTKKRLIDVSDIGRYSLGSLKEKINQIYNTNKNKNSQDNQALYPIIPGTKVLYNGPHGQFAIMSTLEGSVNHNRQVGEFAEWCTADSRAARHYSSHAMQGPLYVYVDPQGEKYQFHFETTQFKDKLDREIGPVREKELISLPFILKNIDWSRAIKIVPEKSLRLLPPEFILSNPELKQQVYNYKLKLVTQNGQELQNVYPELKTPKLCLAAVNQYPDALKNVPPNIRTPELCKQAVKEHGMTLEYVPEKLKTPNLCTLAVKNVSQALKYVPPELKTPELCLRAIRADGRTLEYVPSELRTPELCLEAIKENGMALEYVPTELKTLKLCLAAVNRSFDAFQFVPEEIHERILRKLEMI